MKGFVLFSGGIDSRTCLAIAMRDCDEVAAISVDYGQRHIKEVDQANQICQDLGIEQLVLKIPNMLGASRLTDEKSHIPDVTYDDIEGISPTYVPFRNGSMLSLAASLIDGQLGEHTNDKETLATLYTGTHAEDAKNWAYPDCTPEFIGAEANAIFIGTYQRVRLLAPLLYMRKDEIVKYGSQFGNIYDKTWSCYKGLDLHCGKCPTCYSRQDAFAKAGVQDPTEYAA